MTPSPDLVQSLRERWAAAFAAEPGTAGPRASREPNRSDTGDREAPRYPGGMFWLRWRRLSGS